MSATLKQSIVVENVVGAGGTLGTNRVAKATPDGYTLLLMHVGQATAPALYAKFPFDPIGDFAMIGLVTDVPMIFSLRGRTFPPRISRSWSGACAATVKKSASAMSASAPPRSSAA